MVRAELGQVDPAIESLTDMIAETLSRDMAVATLDTLLAAMPVAARGRAAARGGQGLGSGDGPRGIGRRRHPARRSRPRGTNLASSSLEAPAMDIELAIRDGAALEPLAFLEALPELLRADGPSGSGRHLRHGDLTKRRGRDPRVARRGPLRRGDRRRALHQSRQDRLGPRQQRQSEAGRRVTA